VYGFRDWRAQEPMFTQRASRASALLDPEYRNDPWNRYNMIMHDIQLPVAPMLGIRYFVFPKATDPNHPATPDPGRPTFKRLAFTEGLGLWEMEGVPGFAYLSDYVDAVPSEDAARSWMKGLTWEQVRAYPAVVEAPESALHDVVRAQDGTSPGGVFVPEYTPGHIVLNVDASRTALLVVAESYYPGWNATLDGRPIPILRTNYLSQGIVVPAGKHTVEMKYEPASFSTGAILSAAGLAGLLGLALWAMRGRKPTVHAEA
jgi:Bacterial membrane protein YfhO